MKKIKFKHILQHQETGRFIIKTFDYVDVFNGSVKEWLTELTGYAVVANVQYTGLKDKNGKEIYEGDVVRVEDILSINDPYLGKLGVVEYDTDQFLIIIKGMSSYPLARRCGEVIGNIYENPELLKDGK